jgi:hypothetical protein
MWQGIHDMSRGWIGVDLDGTLANYDGWHGETHVGDPVPKMLARVKEWLASGQAVRIFTARVFPLGLIHPEDDRRLFVGANDCESQANTAAIAILEWCERHVGCRLPITCRKDYAMIELWDDRAIQVVKNTGERVDGQ